MVAIWNAEVNFSWETAIFTTCVEPGFSRSRMWPALRDLRMALARTLGLSGVILGDEAQVLYGLEGSTPDLNHFSKMLGASPCEANARTVWRGPITRRAYPLPRLIAPSLGPAEQSWVRAEIAREQPDTASVDTFLRWLALRQAESCLPDHGARLLHAAEPFPPARTYQ